MSKTHQCPSCQSATNEKATVCNNSACRAPLAFCWHCRDLTTYGLVEERLGKMVRTTYRCDRCEGLGVRCLTWMGGGYCNGLARPGKHVDRPFCPTCSGKAAEVVRTVIGSALLGLLGGIFKRR